MLVLTRGVGERIQIGEGMVEIISIHKTRVRFGFKFPSDTMIFRSEISAEERAMLTDQLRVQQGEALRSEDGSLILERYVNESFEIGSELFIITLMSIKNKKVSIGIKAPREIPIRRLPRSDRDVA